MTDEELKAHAATIEKYLIDSGVEGNYVIGYKSMWRLGDQIMFHTGMGSSVKLSEADDATVAMAVEYAQDWIRTSKRNRESAARASQEYRSRIAKFVRSLVD